MVKTIVMNLKGVARKVIPNVWLIERDESIKTIAGMQKTINKLRKEVKRVRARERAYKNAVDRFIPDAVERVQHEVYEKIDKASLDD